MMLSLSNHYTSIHNYKIYIQQERTNLHKIIEHSINYKRKNIIFLTHKYLNLVLIIVAVTFNTSQNKL